MTLVYKHNTSYFHVMQDGFTFQVKTKRKGKSNHAANRRAIARLSSSNLVVRENAEKRSFIQLCELTCGGSASEPTSRPS